MSEGGYHKAGTETYHGGIIGWAYGLSLTRKCPLYLEFGFTLDAVTLPLSSIVRVIVISPILS